jgi:L-Lysine epsilon oxidase N-terminal/L-lysine epsilon oxidase C-terminal domain/von Willebrand factor type A domain
MAITAVKIHPAIGIARLGNSPDEFYIGPERVWELPDPPGGFKDSQCRVKRQAARFRLYAYHDDGSITEITADDADISWTVHVVNKKAVTRNPGAPAADMTIDPGARTLEGPDQREVFDTGKITFPGAAVVTVPLGEARTDDDGHLLVLGGFGTSASPTNQNITNFLDNAGWYDDVSDGPVTAHVTIQSTGDEFDAAGAWAIVGPPKFAPQIENVITLYDRVFQMAVDQNWRAGPATPSYTNDVFPILERARTTRHVRNVFGAHTWVDPVYAPLDRQAIFNRLKNPSGGGGDMPRLNSAALTSTQYAVMEDWLNNNFSQDWSGPPTPSTQLTPEEVDRAALTACVGDAFYPGIEAGGIAAVPIVDPTNYVGSADPMRLNHANVSPGEMSEFMALPWQADFKACGSDWWPVPRPNNVLPQGSASYEAWDRDVGSFLEMVAEWHTLGFVVRQGNQYVEVDRCDTTFVTLLTPHLDFQDVPQGPMGMSRKTALAIAFEVKSTGAAVTLEVQPGDGPTHPRVTLVATSDTVGPTAGNAIATARLWVLYETGPVNEVLMDQVTVRHVASGKAWTVTITANTVARKVAAAALVLDRSGSMTEDRGDGQSKYQSLKEAASIFVDVMLEGDGVGIARYNEDAQPLQAVTALGPPGDPFDTARQNTKDTINGPGLTPSGATSIGDGIFEGRQLLTAAGAAFDGKSLVVLTDGKENSPRFISDVAGQINELTYAVGLGTPENTSAPALQTISGNHGGYLLVTGAITGDNRFVLQKYFLQILAGISNAEVVLDPDGILVRGQEQRIPFQLSEADSGVDVILLTEHPQAVDFRLQTPSGFIVQPWRAVAEPSMTWVLSQGLQYYRVVLPTELFTARYDQAGTWHVLVTIGRPQVSRPEDGVEPERIPEPGAPTLPESAPGRRDAIRRLPPLQQQGRGVEGVVQERAVFPAIEVHGQPRPRLPYSVLVHSYSSLSLRVSLRQTGFEPGATIHLTATLAESGIPPRPGSSVSADVSQPDGTSPTVVLTESHPGSFQGSFATSASGVYRCRVRASGRTRQGYPFQRERTVTAAVWHGGDRDADPDTAGGGAVVGWLDELDERLCRLFQCLLSERGAVSPELERQLERSGVDLDRLRRCLAVYCRSRPRPDAVEEAGAEEDGHG